LECRESAGSGAGERTLQSTRPAGRSRNRTAEAGFVRFIGNNRSWRARFALGGNLSRRPSTRARPCLSRGRNERARAFRKPSRVHPGRGFKVRPARPKLDFLPSRLRVRKGVGRERVTRVVTRSAPDPLPSGDQKSPLVFQGSISVPDLCYPRSSDRADPVEGDSPGDRPGPSATENGHLGQRFLAKWERRERESWERHSRLKLAPQLPIIHPHRPGKQHGAGAPAVRKPSFRG